MKLKEILEDSRKRSDKPMGFLSYAREHNNKIEVGRMVAVSFRKEDEEKTLERMEEIVQESGFMFFMNSEEGIKFVDDNRKVLAEYLRQAAMNIKF